MRYIGSKIKILEEIDKLLEDKGLNKKGLVFFDAFSGTASVGHHYKDKYKLIANDNLYFSYVLTQAKLNSPQKMFETLGLDPFEYFNGAQSFDCDGFFTKNFAPVCSERMYFSHENAQKIDFIRTKIDEWYAQSKITESEKFFLLASLIESVSKVANVAGVYGAYLKKWDPRATKRMEFVPIDAHPHAENTAEVHNDDILNVIKNVHGDILYLDPPYTRNQYAVQYHLLETLARYDAPVLKGKTGARDMSKYCSDFSRDGKAQVAFEQLIADAEFQYIIVSYSSDGIMSKEYIESVLKRYGKAQTFELRQINYRRYKNSIAESNDSHCEYLFFIEKKEKARYASPLNFIGGKHDMIDFIYQNMPKQVETFYDLFAGGFNVGINSEAQKIVYNDINFKVKELLEYITNADMADFYKFVQASIVKFGLGKANKDAYLKLRQKYNSTAIGKRDCRELFLLIMYGYQQQIRFNSQYDYNNPVGQAGFNDKILEKLVSFSRIAKEKDIAFYSEDYETFYEKISPADFVYVDPPYLITLGSYNDGKRGFNGWNEAEEARLLRFLGKLNQKRVRFMLSNVLHHNGKTNAQLLDWIEKNGYKVIEYVRKARGNREEVLVCNYEVKDESLR